MHYISTFCAVLLLFANVCAADVRTNNDIFFDRALITKENVQEAIAHEKYLQNVYNRLIY
jgi:azurin